MTWKDLEHTETSSLIDFIKYKGQPDYQELAESAFAAFTFRFRQEIIDRCRKMAKKWSLDREDADLIADRTFERFWKYPLGFEKTKCKSLEIDNCVRLYLFRIASNCFYDYSKKAYGEEKSPYDGEEDIVVEFPDLAQMKIPKEKLGNLMKTQELIEQALSRLTPKHKIIYLTYKTFEKDGFKLPRSLLKTLREELGLTQNSIRVYKKEVFEQVDQNLQAHGSE